MEATKVVSFEDENDNIILEQQVEVESPEKFLEPLFKSLSSTTIIFFRSRPTTYVSIVIHPKARTTKENRDRYRITCTKIYIVYAGKTIRKVIQTTPIFYGEMHGML